jgi:lipoprotein-anchoring transpeptidase ErfK/SrfK
MRTFLLLCCVLVSVAEVSVAQAPVVSDVLAAQVMLDRAGFSSGEIDGRSGSNTKRAVSAFQQSEGLPVTGMLDAATWQRLSERGGNVQPLTTYVVSEADVAGPFAANIPADLMEQSKLKALDYKSPLEAIGEKFHSSPGLLQQLNRGAAFARAGEEVMVPNVTVVELPSPEPARGRGRGRGRATAPIGTTGTTPQDVTIYVTKATSALTVEDAAGKVIFHAPVTSGSEHDPLPIGTWKVTTVQRNPAFNYNPELFWDADPKHAKARIAPGPNNPVGTIWIDITKEHYGIHGSPEPSRIGHTESHGCVRLTNWDVARVAQWARQGTPVIFR